MRCISASTCKTSSRRPASGRRPGWIACCRASCASSRTTRRVPCSPASLHRIPLTTVPAGGSAISRVGIARRGRACRRARSISFHRSLASSRPRRSSTSRVIPPSLRAPCNPSSQKRKSAASSSRGRRRMSACWRRCSMLSTMGTAWSWSRTVFAARPTRATTP